MHGPHRELSASQTGLGVLHGLAAWRTARFVDWPGRASWTTRFANCQFMKQQFDVAASRTSTPRSSYFKALLRGYIEVKAELAHFMDWRTGYFGPLRELYFVPTH